MPDPNPVMPPAAVGSALGLPAPSLLGSIDSGAAEAQSDRPVHQPANRRSPRPVHRRTEEKVQALEDGLDPVNRLDPPDPVAGLDPLDPADPALDWSIDGYCYTLPPDRIAQAPATPRDASRLLVVTSPTTHDHRQFRDLPDLLRSGDLLVLNNTSVIPARLFGRKTSGAAAEILLLEARSADTWLALARPGKRLPVGSRIEFFPADCQGNGAAIDALAPKDRLAAEVLAIDPATGGRLLRFEVPQGQPLLSVLGDWGTMPLPPYITDATAPTDRYQTVYADRPGSAAAPTAGLHFTPELLDRLSAAGIGHTFVTLHVGVGTFRPVEVRNITEHKMHAEWAEVSTAAADRIRQTREQGGRIIAVGTTATRTLEAAAANTPGSIGPFCGKTDLFIYPGYRWRIVDGLITNFHLPKSSLMMLVGALIGRARLLDLYEAALAAPAESFGDRYRFYSFGDAMLCLPEATQHT